jgi:glucokinase
MPAMSKLLAADIGGTHIRVATFSFNDPKPIERRKKTWREINQPIFDQLTEVIDSLWEREITLISIASPGPLDAETGTIINTPNIPEWNNFPLSNQLKERYQVDVLVNNDANLAAFGEWHYGAGHGYHDLIYLTISTGIGSGVISKDKLITGHQGLGTELGHTTVMPGGPICSCGQRGHLEAVASGPAIVRYVRENLNQSSILMHSDKKLTAKVIADAAAAGDRLALDAFSQAGMYIGQALADHVHIFNPGIIIIGGGVAESDAILLDPAKVSLKQRIMDPRFLEDLVITRSKLGDDSGLMGAFAIAQIVQSKINSSNIMKQGD